MSAHSTVIQGVNWLFEPTVFNATDNVTGYRGAQGNGISEHYEMLFSLPRTAPANPPVSPSVADYLYSTKTSKIRWFRCPTMSRLQQYRLRLRLSVRLMRLLETTMWLQSLRVTCSTARSSTTAVASQDQEAANKSSIGMLWRLLP
jgi:hypothetical protein